MITDAQLLFSSAQALSGAGNTSSTNYIDLTKDRDIGVGTQLSVVIKVDVAADFAQGDETYAVAIRTDDNTSFSTPTTLISYTFVAADRAAGAKIVIPFPHTNERYVELFYTLGGTSPSVTLTASLVENAEEIRTYPSGYTIQ